MKKKVRLFSSILAVSTLATFAVPAAQAFAESDQSNETAVEFTKSDTQILKSESVLSTLSNLTPLPDDDEEVQVIVQMEAAALLDEDSYKKSTSKVSDYLTQGSVMDKADTLKDSQQKVLDYINQQVDQNASFDHQYTALLNGFSITTAYKNLNEIKAAPGVKDAFVAEKYEIADPVTTTDETGANDVAGATQVLEQGKYKGEGTTIAILDTGLDTTHPAFQNEVSEPANSKDDIAQLLKDNDLNAEVTTPKLSANNVYHSSKVVYAYDYADKDVVVDPTNTATAQNNLHGTHVAGIAAGYEEGYLDIDGEVQNFTGAAPEAQLMIMKVFPDDSPYSSQADSLAALEDTVKLGADVINMSLGSPLGFTVSSNDLTNKVYNAVRDAGITLMVSAGNETNSYQGETNKLSPADHPDSGVVGAGSTYPASMSVASFENDSMYLPYFGLNDGSQISYQNSSNSIQLLDNGAYDYEVIPGNGEEADYANLDVTGKIVLVQRGVTSFVDKVNVAAAQGAIAVIVYDNVADSPLVSMAVDDTTIPSAFITLGDGETFKNQTTKTVDITETPRKLDNPQAGYMSDFSSIGVTPDLKLKPEITAVGGHIYSTMPAIGGTSYGDLSGTSMSSPQLAGIAALVKESVKEKFPNATPVEQREIIDNVLMSTAKPVIDPEADGEVPYTPRKQGAGLVDTYAATEVKAYLSTAADENGVTRPRANLGDDVAKDGQYSFTFTLHNASSEDQTYTLGNKTLAPAVETIGNVNYQSLSSVVLGAQAQFSADTINVPAGETQEITVNLNLSDADKTYLDSNFVNGSFVDGFVTLTAQDENISDLVFPYMGFYGDWNQQPGFDNKEYSINNTNLLYPETVTTAFGESEVTLGQNVFADTDPAIIFDQHRAISPDGDGYGDFIYRAQLENLRSAKGLIYDVVNEQGTSVYKDEATGNINKVYYDSTAGRSYSITEEVKGVWDGTDSNGTTVPDGNYSLNVTLDPIYDNGVDHSADNTIAIDFAVDTVAPTLDEIHVVKEGNSTFLEGKVSDTQSLMFAVFYTVDAVGKIADGPFAPTPYDDGATEGEFKLDITNMGSEPLLMAVMDSAYNETDNMVSLTNADGSSLEEAIKQAEAVLEHGKDDYNSASVTALEEAVAAAKEALADPTTEQSAIDEQIANLKAAIDALGTKLNGWISTEVGWSFYKEDVAQTGWLLDKQSWYFLNESGIMQTGWQKVSGVWYYFDNSGAMKTGWQYINGIWYYLKDNGYMQIGWQKIAGVWYYFDSNGHMKTGWQQVNNTWYYFNDNGYMQTGWKQVKGVWYYFNTSGAMKTGWLQIGSTWYYLESSGKMAVGTKTIAGVRYTFDNSGKWIK